MGQEPYTIYQLLDKKKRAHQLNKEEMHWFINSLMNQSIADYQASALLMAMFINTLSNKETAFLTDAMLYSGEVLRFDDISVVDKHSTGGIGDKASFILAPIAAAAGVKVPMIAGRGLGFTGGTVDKIESVPGFKTQMTLTQFSDQLQNHGIVLMGQTQQIAPADKILYALRDVTATIDSVPLITASIMSKKLAEGANGIVMDIKVGSGAFMKSLNNGRQLARSILKTSKRFEKKAVAIISNMDQPLGKTVGHSLEIKESIDVLKGEGAKDLRTLSLELAAHMIHLAGIEKGITKARKKAKQVLEQGLALEKFRQLIELQGGDPRIIEQPNLLAKTQTLTPITAQQTGYIKSFANDEIGMACTELGGGRKVKSDAIDFAVGFSFEKKIGDRVIQGEPIGHIHHHPHQKELVEKIIHKMNTNTIELCKKRVKKPKIIYETLALN